jgi:PIN domain nuclease of toxin-antitoxin system
VITDRESTRLLSVVVPWELAIKVSTGKLELLPDITSFIEDVSVDLKLTLLPLSLTHALRVATLPYIRDERGHSHRDPFDRLLVAQAIVEGVPIVSRDRWLARYGVEVIW